MALKPSSRAASESRPAVALVVSLLLHLLVWLGFLSHSLNVETPVSPEKPLEVTIVTVPAESAPVSGAGEEAAPEKSTASKKAARNRPATPPLELSPDPPPLAGAAKDIPRLAVKTPSWLLPGLGQDRGEPAFHGQTEVNDGGLREEDDPQWQAARAEVTTKAWAKGALAEARAQNGIVSPYYYDLRHKLQELTGKPPPFKSEPTSAVEKVVQATWDSWSDARERYGKTGQPYAEPEGYNPNYEVPAQIQRMAEQGDRVAKQIQMQLYARARLRDLGEGRMGVELEARVQLKQGNDGAVRSATLIKSSGSKSFDAFVLEKTPMATHALVDAGVLDVGKERSSIWAFIGNITYYHSMDEAKSLDEKLWANAKAGLLGAKFEEMTGTREYIDLMRPVYNCRVKLISVEEE